MALALSTLHCSGSSGKTTDGTASDSIAADSKPPARTAAQQLLFAGWVDRPSQPMVLSLEVQDGNVKGTVTYAKFGKPIALKGTQTNGQFVLEERLDGKQTGEWSFAWDMSAGRSDLEGKSASLAQKAEKQYRSQGPPCHVAPDSSACALRRRAEASL